MILEAAADWGLSERPRASAAARLAARRHQGRESPRCCPPSPHPRDPQALGGGRAAKPAGSEVLRSQFSPLCPPHAASSPRGSPRRGPHCWGGGRNWGGAPHSLAVGAHSEPGRRQAEAGRAGAAVSWGTIPLCSLGLPGCLEAWQRCWGWAGTWDGLLAAPARAETPLGRRQDVGADCHPATSLASVPSGHSPGDTHTHTRWGAAGCPGEGDGGAPDSGRGAVWCPAPWACSARGAAPHAGGSSSARYLRTPGAAPA